MKTFIMKTLKHKNIPANGRISLGLKNMKIYKGGFTLIELLVVISIIGLLSTLAMVALKNARMKSRDAKRMAEMKQVQTALDLYYDANNSYPISDYDGCGGWDVGNKDYQFMTNKLPGFLSSPPRDSTATGNCAGYFYYRYNAGDYGCDINRGNYYVLGVLNMETSGMPHPSSPGWQCSGRNWQAELEWVTGRFER